MATAKRTFSRHTVIVLVVFGLLFGFAAGALAVDERLYSADLNLEKAYYLVQAARDVTEHDPKTERAYDRALAKAQDSILRAQRHVADAIAIADGP